jgi:lipopolysaccharide transport system ATP-binding protein
VNVLRLERVSLAYRRRVGPIATETETVLRDVSIDLLRGETLGVIGRNGCGKSSLLRLMAGILRPTAGRIEVAPGLSRAVLALGLGFRDDLSGRDNALLSAMLQGCPRNEAIAALPVINDFAELGRAFERPVGTYSSGMRARLGFATALINHVDVLLIDEVLAVGDGAFREKAATALKERISGDLTVVLVSHNLKEIEALCDRAVWIERGAVRREGATAAITAAYREDLRASVA